jgi:23S rRNA (uracil1939-C5)-methyltransferase
LIIPASFSCRSTTAGVLPVAHRPYLQNDVHVKSKLQDIDIENGSTPLCCDVRGFSVKTLRIESLAAGGRGVAREEGKVWMVEGSVPGDLVEAEVIREKKRFGEAQAVTVLEPSPDRREPPCRFQGVCGGCPWMVLDEERQRTWKRRMVVDSLERIAKVVEPPVSDVIQSPKALGYRGKAEFTVGEGPNGKIVIGYRHKLDPSRVVDIDMCPVLPDPLNRVLRLCREQFGARKTVALPATPEESGVPDSSGRRLVLRYSFQDGKVLVGFRSNGREWGGQGYGPPPGRILKTLGDRRIISGVVAITGVPGRRGGVRTRGLIGSDSIREQVAATSFRLPAATFFQVNPITAAHLVRTVLEMAGENLAGQKMLDLYGGSGLYGHALARAGAEVTVCEADGHAVRCGEKVPPAEPGGKVPEFVKADVGYFLEKRADQEEIDVVVANPPRSGMGTKVAGQIASRQPARVIIVSCDPGTLARDLQSFLATGYKLERVVPVDLFPQTAHVETVSLLVRNN